MQNSINLGVFSERLFFISQKWGGGGGGGGGGGAPRADGGLGKQLGGVGVHSARGDGGNSGGGSTVEGSSTSKNRHPYHKYKSPKQVELKQS